MPLPSYPRKRFALAIALAVCALPFRGAAVTCNTQSQMAEADRAALLDTVKSLAAMVQAGNTAEVQAHTISLVRSQFAGIAGSIQQTSPLMAGASITIDALYGLDASDLPAGQPETQFFCQAAGSPVHVEISIPQLPKGTYALALVHATGVAHPQQIVFLLQRDQTWQLAGFFVKPMLVAGHDSVWFWTKAREFAAKGDKWDAYFYYTTADYLSSPSDLLSSSNLEKLRGEETSLKPQGLPGAQPMTLAANGQTYAVTDLHTDGSLGGFDLVIRYLTADTSDPVAARARNLDVMKAMLNLHPELRQGFQGLWVFAEAPNQRPFGIELPVSQIH